MYPAPAESVAKWKELIENHFEAWVKLVKFDDFLAPYPSPPVESRGGGRLTNLCTRPSEFVCSSRAHNKLIIFSGVGEGAVDMGPSAKVAVPTRIRVRDLRSSFANKIWG